MEDIVQQILNIPAETMNLEFKRLSGENVVSKCVETITAFANTEGGFLILGVDDPEKTKLKGFKRVFGIEENLENFDTKGRELQKVVPPLAGMWPPTKFKVPEAENRTIGFLHIPKATSGFYTFSNRVYMRQEKGNKPPLTPQEIVKLSYAKGFVFADRELMETKCAIRVFQYEGTIEKISDVPNLIGTPKTIEGPIIKLIREANAFVLNLLRDGIKMSSGFVNKYLIPERAITEAITNAVIHRDYHLLRDIEINLFEDRVEIESPGLLPFSITSKNIGSVRADAYRNNLLVKHLREFPDPPNLDRNEGVRAMRSVMTAQNLYPPVFYTYPNLNDTVRVVLFNEIAATEWDKVSYFLKENKYIANEDARRITSVKQAHHMSYLFKKWVNQGLLIKIEPPKGGTKGVRYKLSNDSEVGKNG